MGNSPIQPDIRAALSTLLNLFLQFAHARSEAYRNELEAQILSIFDSLGATSDRLVQEARTRFETLRDEPSRTALKSNPWENRAKAIVNTRIKRFESLSSNVKLTKGAREMLRIPVIETADLNHDFDGGQLDESLGRILETMKIPDPQRESRYRNSIDVIRALHQNFCNIPPFCSGRRNE